MPKPWCARSAPPNSPNPAASAASSSNATSCAVPESSRHTATSATRRRGSPRRRSKLSRRAAATRTPSRAAAKFRSEKGGCLRAAKGTAHAHSPQTEARPGLLADADHLRHHAGKYIGFLEWIDSGDAALSPDTVVRTTAGGSVWLRASRSMTLWKSRKLRRTLLKRSSLSMVINRPG